MARISYTKAELNRSAHNKAATLVAGFEVNGQRSYVTVETDPMMADCIFAFICTIRSGIDPREAFERFKWPTLSTEPSLAASSKS